MEPEQKVESFPSTPISFWIPGTKISSNAVGYIPLYNRKLGVFNLSDRPVYTVYDNGADAIPFEGPNGEALYYYQYTYTLLTHLDFRYYLMINPAVKEIADVEIVGQDIIWNGKINPDYNVYGTSDDLNSSWSLKEDPVVCLTVKVTPKNGAPPSIIVKTFMLTLKVV